MTACCKTLGFGKIIGVRIETLRWIVFTSSKGLVDGSSYRCYRLGMLYFNGV